MKTLIKKHFLFTSYLNNNTIEVEAPHIEEIFLNPIPQPKNEQLEDLFNTFGRIFNPNNI